jgi:hypothetical protein
MPNALRLPRWLRELNPGLQQNESASVRRSGRGVITPTRAPSREQPPRLRFVYLDVRKSVAAVGSVEHNAKVSSISNVIYNNNIACFLPVP